MEIMWGLAPKNDTSLLLGVGKGLAAIDAASLFCVSLPLVAFVS
jgi:hypothetical protein